jgi:vacuolar protein sorting-associated protein 26
MPPGTIEFKDESSTVALDFSFKTVEKEYESYRGTNADVRYFIRVTCTRTLFSVVKEQEFWVHCLQPVPTGLDPGINMVN